MNILKKLSLAIAVVAAMSFVAASTVSAETTLCSATSTPCGESEDYDPGSTLESESEAGGEGGELIQKVTFTAGGFTNVACDSARTSTLITKTTPVYELKEKNWTWANCTGGSVLTSTGGTITVHHDAEHNGLSTYKGFLFEVEHKAGLVCFYGSEFTATLTAGKTPVEHITAKIKKVDTPEHDSNFLCPGEAALHATFHANSPLYVITGV